jgi:hypothetical protein
MGTATLVPHHVPPRSRRRRQRAHRSLRATPRSQNLFEYLRESQFNQREESPARGRIVSSSCFFETLGSERVVAGGASTGTQIGVSTHHFSMWMLDSGLGA